jgi:hypothetical protein
VRSLNFLWALVGALEPWPEGRDWREVAASPERLAWLVAVEEALTPGTEGEDKPVWVPGL